MRRFKAIMASGFLIGLLGGSAFGQTASPPESKRIAKRPVQRVDDVQKRSGVLRVFRPMFAARTAPTHDGAQSERGQVAARFQSPNSGWLESVWKITSAQPQTKDASTLLLTEQRTDEVEEIFVDDSGEVIIQDGFSCACPPGDVCSICCPPHFAHKTGGYGEWLYLHPSDVDFTFSIPRNGAAPMGAVGIVDPGYESAFRAGFAVALDSCSRR